MYNLRDKIFFLFILASHTYISISLKTILKTLKEFSWNATIGACNWNDAEAVKEFRCYYMLLTRGLLACATRINKWDYAPVMLNVFGSPFSNPIEDNNRVISRISIKSRNYFYSLF